jgi:Uma2 family endonuclease
MSALLEDEEIRGLDRLPPDALYEVIDGEAKEVPPMSADANVFAFEFGFHVRLARQSPRDVVTTETLFALPAPVDRRRRPDLAYLPAARVPPSWPPAPGTSPPAIEAVPALVVEVVSPTDYAAEVEEKRIEYLRVGVQTVLIVYPAVRTMHVHDPAGYRVLTPADTLAGLTALPALSVPVADLFAPLNRP